MSDNDEANRQMQKRLLDGAAAGLGANQGAFQMQAAALRAEQAMANALKPQRITVGWIVRRARTAEYLWGWLAGSTPYDSYPTYGIVRSEQPKPEWGSQGGATRYVDRVKAVRDAARSGGRLVKLTRKVAVPT